VSKKIIVISNGNNNLNFLKHWFIKDLSKKYLVEIWNVDKIIGFDRVHKCSLNIKSRKIQTILKLKKELEKNKNNKLLFIMAVSYFYNSIGVYYTLTKYSKFLVFLNWGYLPSPSSEKSIIKRVRNLYKSLPNPITFIEKFFKITIAKIIRAVLIKKYDLSFNAGSEAKKYNYAKKNFAIHLCDYDDFLESKNLKKKILQFF